MPLYEYVAREDGTVLEVLRPMTDADKPLPDPDGMGRTFTRRLSTFAAQGTSTPSSRSLPLSSGAACGCGKPHGSCSRRA